MPQDLKKLISRYTAGKRPSHRLALPVTSAVLRILILQRKTLPGIMKESQFLSTQVVQVLQSDKVL
jgi:hypothetical protein